MGIDLKTREVRRESDCGIESPRSVPKIKGRCVVVWIGVPVETN